MSLFGCGKALTEGFFHIMVLAIGVHLAVKGEIEFAEIFTYSMLFLNVMAPLSEVHRIIDEGQEASLRVNDLLQILDSPIDRSFVASKRISPSMDKPGPIVAVDNLVVEYESADGQTRRALEGVTFEIRRGERIGIAGRSGGGKSTWLKALLRLTHPIAGRVFLGGAPLDEVSRESIAELIGYVGQQPFVCEGTIAQNIAYGIKGATPEQIRQAAEAACIHDEIMAMPGGYNASVSERGQNLSGGQKQRIALARLFLKNPPIMILDEATSALDSISEKRVQRAIAETRPDRTVIIVAHRLSTLLDTDRILVFDHGNIVESGSFNDLVQQAGVFAELLMSSQNPSSSRPVPEHASEQPLQPAALAAT
jgi:ATP-binding cassette subfamily B protein